MKIRSHFTFCHGTRQRYWKYVTLPRISYAFPADTRSSIMFQIVGLAAQRPLRFHDLIKDTHNHTVLVPTSVMQATMSNPTFSPVESLLQLHSLMFIVWIRQFFVKYGMWSESTAVRSRGRARLPDYAAEWSTVPTTARSRQAFLLHGSCTDLIAPVFALLFK